MFQQRKDYKKVNKVIDSCTNIHQHNTAMNMVLQFGKMYNFNHSWRDLDRKAWRVWQDHFDMIEIKERENEQETPVNPEG